MIKTRDQLNLKIKNARLLTRDELINYEDKMPDISMGCCWWLADVDGDDVAYAEGNYTDDDMYCSNNESNTWLRVALDIEGDIDVGDEFVHCGYVFTALSKNLAISNNFLGCAKYLDEEMCSYIDGVGRIPTFTLGDENECTLGDVIYTMICVEDEDDYEVIEGDDNPVEVFDTIDDETRAQLGVLDLDD